jgi:hypothetical protein
VVTDGRGPLRSLSRIGRPEFIRAEVSAAMREAW